MNKIKDYIRLFIGWPLAIVSIIFILKLIYDRKTQLIFGFGSIHFSYLLAGILLFFAYYLLRSFLWGRALNARGYSIPFKENAYRFSFSELKRYAPGNVWSFLSRGSQFSDLGVDKKTIGVSIFADIQLVIIGCGIVSFLSAPWILDSPNKLRIQLESLFPLSITASILFFIAIAYIYKKRYREKGHIIGNIILPGFKLKDKVRLILISLATYFLFGVASYFTLLGFFNIGFQNVFPLSAFFTLSLLVGYLSFLTPTGLGVREAVVTLGLTNILGVGDAGAASISTRVILILSELLFLFIIFLWKKYSGRK